MFGKRLEFSGQYPGKIYALSADFSSVHLRVFRYRTDSRDEWRGCRTVAVTVIKSVLH